MAEFRLPSVGTLDRYREIYQRDDIWRPVIEAICRRHTFLTTPLQRGGMGTHIVYFAGSHYVVKLFVPLFAEDFIAEGLTADYLGGKLNIEMPEIVARGQIDGWNYLILTRIAGVPLNSIWDQLSQPNRVQIVQEVGQLIFQLRSIPVQGLGAISTNWPVFLQSQISQVSSRFHGIPELPWDPVAESHRFFTEISNLLQQDFSPTLLLADITQEHIFVQQQKDRWKMTGYLDFGDAMVGHPDYEVIAPGLELAAGNPDLLRVLLRAAGYSENDLNESLSFKLLAYTLLHRFVELSYVFEKVPQTMAAIDLRDLASRLWPL